MSKVELFIDGLIPLRNALLLLKIGGKEPVLNSSLLNMLPISTGEFKFNLPDDALVKENGIYKVKDDLDVDVKDFYNKQLTNHLNIYLHYLAEGYVDDYTNDIADVVKFSLEDNNVKLTLDKFNQDLDMIMSMCSNDESVGEIETFMPDDAHTLVYPWLITSIYLDKVVPTNKYLKRGVVMSITPYNTDPEVKELYNVLDSSLKDTGNIIGVIDKEDNEYLVVRKSKEEYYISNININTLFKLTKFIPV